MTETSFSLLIPAGYALERPVDASASTAIFEVRHLVTGRLYVCKRLSTRTRADRGATEAMEREGRALERIGGRGAPRLVEVGRDERGPWLVMEKVEMRTLGEHVAAPKAPSWIERASRAAFARLADVHEQEVIHGDLSPRNVAVAENGDDARLLDFGLARIGGEPAAEGGSFRGTLLYAAPEVARGEAPDERSDLFALAASFLHAATGTPPRSAPNAAALLALAAESAIAVDPAARFPPPLARCLAFSPDDRPRSARLVW
jgi:serine/threonine protein kinase